jgi:hypothetical protein
VKKPEKESVQTAIRLPRETYEWLKARPEGITDTIKRAIYGLMFEQMFDAETLSLASDIMILAKEIQKQTGSKWHQVPKAHEALAEALAVWLERNKPQPLSGAAADLFGPDDPQTLGRAIARTVHNKQAEEHERTLQILKTPLEKKS